jgi:hypothetical protein
VGGNYIATGTSITLAKWYRHSCTAKARKKVTLQRRLVRCKAITSPQKENLFLT